MSSGEATLTMHANLAPKRMHRHASYSPRYLLHLLHRHSKAHNYFLPQIQALLITSSPSIPSTVIHNSLIRAHLPHHGRPDQCPSTLLLHFNTMLRLRVPPNTHTFPPLIHAAAASSHPAITTSLHAQVVARGLSPDPVVATCLIVFYGGNGELGSVRRVFDEIRDPDVVSFNSYLDALCNNGKLGAAFAVFEWMPVRGVVTWTSMINGFKREGRFCDAICLFKEMVGAWDHPVPNEATLVSVLSCVASGGYGGVILVHASRLERQIHGFILRNGIVLTDFIGTALIDCYGKSSFVHYARRVFMESRGCEVCLWNAMIATLASNSLELDALNLFKQMRGRGLKPNCITYVGVLTACSRAGLVDVGAKWFRAMEEEDGIKRTTEHYVCMVDMLGKSGHLKEAAEFVSKMAPQDAEPSVWGALLGACRLHGEVELGEEIGRRLVELQPYHSGRYVVLSNLYAKVERWVDAAQTREDMGNAGVKKTVGVSKAFADC